MALLCAACAPVASGAHPSRHAGAAASAATIAATIATAEAQTYANDYAKADGTYAALLTRSPASAQVHAAFALFLEYRGSPGDAAAEATRAVTLDAHSSMAEAVLCRVRDWAGDLGGAVSAGRAAVSLDASEPLARLFLAEALADSGDLTGSQAQADAAKPLIAIHPTDFLRAELQREIGTIAGDGGRLSDQVQALMPTLTWQPGWLYRAEELAGAQAYEGEVGASWQTLETAAAALPGDIDALKGLGSEAVFIGDSALTRSVWQKAAAVAPRDPTTLDMQGEVEVAVNHDINAAVKAMQHALSVHADDEVAAAYLTGLARFVQHQPALAAAEIDAALQPDAARGPQHPDPAGSLATDAGRALAAVNAARSQAGLPPVPLDQRLSDSATSHSFYWLFNNLAPTSEGLGIHQEAAGLPGFSGATLADRDRAFGYPGQRLAEDITHRDSPVAAVGDWVDSVFHRFPIMRPDLVAIGFGEAKVGVITMQDMEFGYGSTGTAAPVVYPGSGQSSVPVRFVDNELPDPVPMGKQRTTGYPVTVTFDVGDNVSMSGFTLAGPDGVALDAYVMPPSQASENSAWLVPAVPLHAATAYTAHFAGVLDGRSFDRTWSFTTAP